MSAEDDSEGLASHYDLIVLGTGLSESVISCAAGKAGIKVLHLDQNDYYGNKYNSNSLDGFGKFFSKSENLEQQNLELSPNNSTESNFVPLNTNLEDVFIAEYKTEPVTKLIAGTALRTLDSTRVHPSCFGHLMEQQRQTVSDNQKTLNTVTSDIQNSNNNSINKSTTDSSFSAAVCNPVFYNYIKNKSELTLSRLLHKHSRDFNVDTTSRVLLSSGLFIDALISSDVHKYLEFKSIEGIYYFINNNINNNNNKTDEKNELWKVPCSKTDVFNTTKLTVLEKRILMKFYSYILDYGKVRYSAVTDEIYSLNEIELSSGRSLYRPQNKAKQPEPSSADGSVSGYNIGKFIDEPFESFLTDCKISPKLQYIIMYSLCFRTTAPTAPIAITVAAATDVKTPTARSIYTTAEGVFDLYAHINSLGRFGETALLTPIYGTAEIAQAFCRMSAVWGGVFILRRGVQAVCIEEVQSEVVVSTSITDADGAKTAGIDSAVVGDTATEDVKLVAQPRVTKVRDSTGRVFSCDAFVCNANHWPVMSRNVITAEGDNAVEDTTPTDMTAAKLCCTSLTVTRISVCLGYLLPLSRSIAIIPPFATYTDRTNTVVALRNTHAVHVMQTADTSANCAADGTSVLNITTTINVRACSAETDWHVTAAEHRENAVLLADNIMGLLRHTYCNTSVAAECTTLNDFSVNRFRELTSATTLTPLFTATPLSTAEGSVENMKSCVIPSNVGICYDSTESFHLSHTIDTAKKIFTRLFPIKPFLIPKSEEEQGADGDGEGVPSNNTNGEEMTMEQADMAEIANALKAIE